MTKTEKIRNHPKYSTLLEYLAASEDGCDAWVSLVRKVANDTQVTTTDVRNALRSKSGKVGRRPKARCWCCGALAEHRSPEHSAYGQKGAKKKRKGGRVSDEMRLTADAPERRFVLVNKGGVNASRS